MTGDRPAEARVNQSTDPVRIRLELAYDGTGFAGWARQPGQRTVQGELTNALLTVTRLPELAVTVAGRTDAGVHARHQVTHFDLPRQIWKALPGRSNRLPGEALTDRLNGLLARAAAGPKGSSEVVVLNASVAPAGFDARFAPLWRAYRYLVADSAETRQPTRRHDVLWLRPRTPLVLEDMNIAAELLLGEHDFLAFCKPRAGATTIRTLQQFTWERGADGLLSAQVQADAFCHSMVRSLVGATLEVGLGRRPVEWVAEVLAAKRRDSAVPVAPAHGLTLMTVHYPPADQLAARVRQSRHRRDEPCCS